MRLLINLFICLAIATPALAANEIKVTLTDGSRKLAEMPPISWGSRGGGDLVISVDPSKHYQQVLGFGGAFTDSACFVFNNMQSDARSKLFENLFAPNQLDLTVNRIPMGSSDYATHVYSYDDSTDPDPELKKFNIDHDRKYILPMLKQALNVNHDMFFFGSPWSPPGWMKSNGTMLGGNMQRKYMPSYAVYFRKFIESYGDAHVPIKAVTVQNEVDTDQDSRMPACIWPQEYEVDFVRMNLGPLLRKSKLDTQIWIIDHNYNLWGRALASLEEHDIKDFVSGIAWHGYVGDIGKLNDVHAANPSIQMHWTEGGPDVTDPEYQTAWTKWSTTFSDILHHWCTSITVWNLALDEQGKPNVGPFPCGGLVTVDSKTGEVTYSGQYYALAHLSKFVKPGAQRIASTGAFAPDLNNASQQMPPANYVTHVAFRNEDGSTVVVLTNPTSAEIQTSVVMNDQSAAVNLPPDSVTSLVMSPVR